MYAQLVEGGTSPERRAQMDRIVTDDVTMIILWDSEPQARRPISVWEVNARA